MRVLEVIVVKEKIKIKESAKKQNVAYPGSERYFDDVFFIYPITMQKSTSSSRIKKNNNFNVFIKNIKYV